MRITIVKRDLHLVCTFCGNPKPKHRGNDNRLYCNEFCEREEADMGCVDRRSRS